MRYLIFLLALLCAQPAVSLQAGQRLTLAVAYTQDPDALVYRNALVANKCAFPDGGTWMRPIAAFIAAQKGVGNWGTTWDIVSFFTTSDACTASINVAQPSLYRGTFSGGFNLVPNNGFGGDGSTGIMSYGVNQSSLVRYTQNSAYVCVWVGAGKVNVLGFAATGNSLALTNVLNKLTVVNSTAATGNTDTGGGLAGWNCGARTSSSQFITSNNGVIQQTNNASTSTALVANPILVCERGGGFCAGGAAIKAVEIGNLANNRVMDAVNMHAALEEMRSNVQ